VRNLRGGGQCLHVTERFATLAADANAYDFDPRTPPKKSGMTPVKPKDDRGIRRGGERIREAIYVVSADSRRAKIVWRL
jgi:hypothetical protein